MFENPDFNIYHSHPQNWNSCCTIYINMLNRYLFHQLINNIGNIRLIMFEYRFDGVNNIYLSTYKYTCQMRHSIFLSFMDLTAFVFLFGKDKL